MRARQLQQEDINHILRVGVILFFAHLFLLGAHHSGLVSALPLAALWALVIRTCWRSVKREADLLFAAQHKTATRDVKPDSHADKTKDT